MRNSEHTGPWETWGRGGGDRAYLFSPCRPWGRCVGLVHVGRSTSLLLGRHNGFPSHTWAPAGPIIARLIALLCIHPLRAGNKYP